jgi:AcrR family transcriptional regulator
MQAKEDTVRKLPRQERSSFLFESMISAAGNVFAQFGFDEASTARIAEKAGVSVGSLYQYFPNKGALVTWVAKKIAERHLKELEAAIARVEPKTVQNIADAAIDLVTDLHFSDRRLMRTLQERSHRPEIVRLIGDIRRRAAKVLCEALPKDELAEPENAERSVVLLVHAMMGILEASALEEPGRALEDSVVRSELKKIAVRYLAAGAGRAHDQTHQPQTT